MPPSPANPWKRGTFLKEDAVGSPVHYRSRGKWCDGVIEVVGEASWLVRVRLPNGRSKAFRKFYRDGENVWLTGLHGHSKTRLWPGTSAEWEVEAAALRAELDAKG